jgi:AraC-like DNA-binding protein
MINKVALQKFYEAVKIPLQLFDNDLLIQSYSSGDFLPNPALCIISCAENTTCSVCYTVSPEYLFYGLVRIQNSSEYVIVGPAMPSECTQKQARNILGGLQQPINRSAELLSWFSTIPLCDAYRFRGILSFLNYILNEQSEIDVIQIPYEANSLPEVTINMELSFIEHVNDILEKQIVSYVEYGNLTALEAIFNNMGSQPGGVPSVASDAMRSLKNIFIFSTGVVSRAAIKGGLDYDTANVLTSRYLAQVEMLDSYTDITNLIKNMFFDYTRRTARCRLYLSDSLVVNKICKYVQAHLYEKVTPAGISENLNMNYSYLCRHFKQKTGKTITEFINELKISECMRLLETTEMSLIEISEQLGFCSQNYLHKIFKELTGMTLLEYRNNRLK